jgi:hypothetical protein
MSEHRGAALILPRLPAASELIADRGYDSNRFRAALLERGIAPCIPSTRRRKTALPYDKTLYASGTASVVGPARSGVIRSSKRRRGRELCEDEISGVQSCSLMSGLRAGCALTIRCELSGCLWTRRSRF